MSQSPLFEPSRGSGRHRPRRLGGPAGAVTAGIAVTSLAVAGYAVSSSAAAPSTRGLTAAVSRLNPDLAADTAAERSVSASYEAHAAFAEATALREQQALDSLGASADLTSSSVRSARGASDAIAQERAEEAAARRAAEEKAAAETAAAEAAAAEQAAAEEAAAQAAAEREAEQAASRSTPREEAPVSTAPVVSGDSRSIARSMLGSYGWGEDQWGCLDSLWQRESGWNHLAMNPSSGAYGIPQSLPGSKMASVAGDWQTNPTTQITWGLGYISERYGSPCNAWGHSESVGWY